MLAYWSTGRTWRFRVSLLRNWNWTAACGSLVPRHRTRWLSCTPSSYSTIYAHRYFILLNNRACPFHGNIEFRKLPIWPLDTNEHLHCYGLQSQKHSGSNHAQLSKLAANATMNTGLILIPRIITSPPKKSYTWPEGWYLPGRINRHERRTRTV